MSVRWPEGFPSLRKSHVAVLSGECQWLSPGAPLTSEHRPARIWSRGGSGTNGNIWLSIINWHISLKAGDDFLFTTRYAAG
ncbi:hypothetical protein EYF80_025053 [Liparis tanakae]|uniref:Uncharacterized protein n=1 Tax=Liparis tanakae TaxID=230148 RepID=A0A4Z2HFU4_9TELE|nr:hypothetical protein EYF80_025053 [Liparis tanakae]